MLSGLVKVKGVAQCPAFRDTTGTSIAIEPITIEKEKYDVAMERIPRRFWSYTAGKGSAEAEEIDTRRAHMAQAFKENLPGVLGFLVVLFLMAVMLLMMFSEFRGCYVWQLGCLIGNVPLLEFLS